MASTGVATNASFSFSNACPPHCSRDGERHGGPMLSNFVLVFVDDILVFSKTAEEHAKHLEIVFELLRKEQLQIKPSKCVWGQTKLPYLGFVVGKDRIKPDPKKVEAVTAWPTSTTMKEIQQFLGLTNFFRILGYAKLAAPLIELSKKSVVWEWSDARRHFTSVNSAGAKRYLHCGTGCASGTQGTTCSMPLSRGNPAGGSNMFAYLCRRASMEQDKAVSGSASVSV